MAGLSLGGLASGLDTDTIVAQLMAIEGQGKTRLQGRQYRSEQTKTMLDQMATRLRSLKNAADELKSAGSWTTVQTVSSADPARVGARYLSGAASGTYSIEVTKLARADQRFYSHPATVSGATQLDINGVKIDIADGSTIEQTAAAINAKAESPAFASVVGTELVLSGKKTGVELTVAPGFLTEDTLKRRRQENAEFTIDGVAQTPSASNTITTALPGIELTLKTLTAITGPISVEVGSPGPDTNGLKTKVKAFVDAYNSAVDLVKAKTEERPVRTPFTQADFGKGALRGDPGLLSLLARMRQTVTEKIDTGAAAANPSAYDSLSDIGVGVVKGTGSEADRLAGKLVLDEAKLLSAIQQDPTAVRRLMGGVDGVPGVAQALGTLVDPVAKLSDGTLSKRATQTERETARIKDQMLAMDVRLKLKEERLRKQFTAMETALQSSQTSTSWLSGQIAGLGS
jgi:flagellar hook-associated protein 2